MSWCRLITIIAATTTVIFPRPHSEEHHKEDDHQKKYDTVAGPFPGIFLVLSRSLQLLGSGAHKRMSSCHMALDIIQLLSLMLHQHCHVKEHLVQLLEILFYLFDGIMPLLNLIDGVQNSTPSLLLNGLLKESLTLTCKKGKNTDYYRTSKTSIKSDLDKIEPKLKLVRTE